MSHRVTDEDEPISTDRPDLIERIDAGERLWIRSPLGDARTVRVEAVEADAVEVRSKTADPISGRVRRRTERYSRRELRDAWDVGDLVIDPDRPADDDGAIDVNRGP